MFPTVVHTLLPPYPRPLVPSPRRRTPALTAVSARPRHHPRRDRSWEEDDNDDSENGNDHGNFFEEAREEEEEDAAPAPESPARVAPAAAPLRGSDVLRAMQLAAAAKAAERQKKKKAPARREEEERALGDGREKVAGEVKEIEIRSEWAGRIRELELRVQHLVDKYQM